MLRITTGSLKGCVFEAPRHIRATEGKVRQALFNILGERVAQARVIDGFAGSGMFGLEALSRGAKLVVFLEAHPVCLRVIRANLARLDPLAVDGRWELASGDALHRLRQLAGREPPFDIIILDPPYERLWGKKALKVVGDCGILSLAGVLCVEHARRDELPPRAGPLAIAKQHRYGETVLSFYQVE